MRIGLGIPLVGLPIDLCTDLVRQAEERGFDSIWVGEAWGTETSVFTWGLVLSLFTCGHRRSRPCRPPLSTLLLPAAPASVWE
jgi:alkanesulfonate monooxygenase SsuD/methylene tetrahydromethanopterin reductase-like flavin-dependent oxidoreductase (luciferase family)